MTESNFIPKRNNRKIILTKISAKWDSLLRNTNDSTLKIESYYLKRNILLPRTYEV